MHSRESGDRAGGDTPNGVGGFTAGTVAEGSAVEPQASDDGPQVGVAVPGDALNGVKIRFRPAGSHKPVSINDDGNSGQNVAHLYYNGKSSQFQLQKASGDSYYIYFYQHYKDAEPKTTGNCLLDVERTKNDESYMKAGQVIHITDKGTATNKQWELIPQADGTYYLDSDQDSKSDQRYYIDEIMNAGVRHLDLRTGLNDKGELRIIHAGSTCLDRDGKELSFNTAMGWIYSFLDANPTETIVLQVKMDKQGSECELKTFNALQALAKQSNSKIWASDHVPTLKEVRGKIIVISRLDPDSFQGDSFTIERDGKTVQWGLDCHSLCYT